MRIYLCLACFCSTLSELPAQESVSGPSPVCYRNLDDASLDLAGDLLPDQAELHFGTARFQHPGNSIAMAVAPDEKTIVTLGSSRLIAWDMATGEQLWEADWTSVGGHITGTAYGQRFIDFAGNSEAFYTSGKSNTVLKWGARNGTSERIELD